MIKIVKINNLLDLTNEYYKCQADSSEEMDELASDLSQMYFEQSNGMVKILKKLFGKDKNLSDEDIMYAESIASEYYSYEILDIDNPLLKDIEIKNNIIKYNNGDIEKSIIED